MKVRLLGAHNCETRDFRHTCMVVDDVIAIDAGSLASGLTLDEQKAIEALVITHQHYDHIRDVSAFGTNLYHAGLSSDIYTTGEVIDVITEHFFTSGMYRNLAAMPVDKPVFRLHRIVPMMEFSINGYIFKAVPVNHYGLTVGYSVTSPDGKAFFYTADTGPGLAECWREIRPDVIITEVTESNATTEQNRNGAHLTPELLREELISFRDIHGYLPQVVSVHMSPEMEAVIRAELEVVAGALDCSITPGYEGMEIIL